MSRERFGWAESLRPARLGSIAWVGLPLLAVLVFAAPSIDYLLPAYHSHLGENYQPLKALRFFSSPSTDFHKYGPMTNFLLAPGYALSLGKWWLDGSLTSPSSTFPYGFERPLEQISFLLLQGRLLFLALFVGLFASLLVALRRATPHRWAIALAFLFCVGTNYSALGYAANTRPDGPLFAFIGASLGFYVRVLYDGLTIRRGVAMSVLAVCAISAKEVAAPVFVLPYLAVLWLAWTAGRADPTRRQEQLRAVLATLAAGVGTYLLLNVVYAPELWLVRMSHWLTGSGADSSVWGGLGSGAMDRFGFIAFLMSSFLNTLGPGGIFVVTAALVTLGIRRPASWTLLLLPFASILCLGLLPLGYGSDYFTTVATVTLVPPVALGLSQLLSLVPTRGPRQSLVFGGLGVALALNLAFASFAWHRLEGLPLASIERALIEDPPAGESIAMPDWHPHIAGKSRLAWLGYEFDPRSIEQIIEAAHADRPGRLYVTTGQLLFLEDARSQPARVEMLMAEGFDLARWQGFEALGYRRVGTTEAGTPSWFLFDWMPAVRLWAAQSPVVVFERSDVDR